MRIGKALNWVTIVLAIAVAGCASAKSTIYRPGDLARVSTWYVGFTYEISTVEEGVSTEKGEELKIIKGGHRPSDLQLRDDILYALRDEYGIRTSPSRREAEGIIALHPVHFRGGLFKSTDVTLLLPGDDRPLARIRIKNGNRRGTVKDDESFAEYVVGKIADLLREQGPAATSSDPTRGYD